VHACRKFPSRIGSVHEQSLSEIYESEMARRYRAGSDGCRNCVIRPVCGGCLAAAQGSGLAIFEERDPYCFMQTAGQPLKPSGDGISGDAGAGGG
jgi:radical SAM protein with 4Fe4S-binding SPASM domain